MQTAIREGRHDSEKSLPRASTRGIKLKKGEPDAVMSHHRGPSCKLTILAAVAIALAIWAVLGSPGGDAGSAAHKGGPEPWSVARTGNAHR